ncbi:MAG: DUF4147 domain-containing protein, partial [Clostridia bacterium]|nr:DUF4147 domain-containing protein [Clostridia bacterium]
MSIRSDANFIIERAIASAMPDEAVRKALAAVELPDKVYLVAIGKAAAQMAKAAYAQLGDKIRQGVAITKYDHSSGDIGPIKVYEAGHPVLDENSVKATDEVLSMVEGLGAEDTVVFLVSGGGSALFESPLVSLEDLQDISKQLLSCGADIVEMNTIRKRLSAVKGGKIALACAPARIVSVVLSDIIGDPLDMIASGPAYPAASTCEDAIAIVEKYDLDLSVDALELLHKETPDKLDNVETYVTGSVRQLCAAASEAAQELGYRPVVLTASLCCEAKDAGSFLASIAQYHKDTTESLAFIAGGETVVRITGEGLGGRNQELALSAAQGIAGLENTAVFSVGSDGTDGPTDAAGGYADGDTAAALEKLGVSIPAVLKANDS